MMIPIFVFLVAIVAMAKRSNRGRRRVSNFVAIPFEVTLTLSTLADNTVLAGTILSNNFARDIYLISVDATFSLFGGTAGEGPIGVGFSHSDLSVGEIAEALTAEVSDPSDIIAKERARRPVRRTGSFKGLSTNEDIADGQMVRTPLKFAVTDGKQLSAWAVNRSNGALTGGQIVVVEGTIYGRWQ